jgi:uncharacterized membrane protein
MTHRRDEPTRLEAFSDAAFAFALTLLVVSLEVPHSYGELMALARGLPAFACCFSLLVWIWHEHNMFFRRYGLQDGYTVFLNSVLLFVVMFYVYPLKFMFDSMFAMIPALRWRALEAMTLEQLRRASALYALGFVILFVMFVLLYRHALSKRDELALTPMEEFEARSVAGHHVVRACVGLLALLVALAFPRRMAFVSPMCFVLMGPAHAFWGARWGKQRRAMEARSNAGT